MKAELERANAKAETIKLRDYPNGKANDVLNWLENVTAKYR